MGKTLFLVFLIFVYAPITPCRAAIQQSDSMYDTPNRDFGDSQNTDNNMGGMDENSGYGANDYNNFGGGIGSSMPGGSFNQNSSNFGGSMGGSTRENSIPENSSNQDASASDPNAGTDMLSHMTLDQRARYWHMQEEKLKQAEDKTLRDHPGDFGGWFWGLGIGYAHTNTATNTAIYSGSDAQGTLFLGYGKVWDKKTKNHVYGGGEIYLTYNSLNARTNSFKLKGGVGGGILGRMGVILHKKFMPYFLVGVDYDSYRLFQSNKKNFNTLSIIPGVGIEYLFAKSFSARVEFKYSFGIAAGGISQSILIKKPRKSVLQMGAVIKF